MERFSIQPREAIFLNGYGFLSVVTNMCKNIG